MKTRSTPDNTANAEALARLPAEDPNPVLRLNRDGIVLYANRASESLLRAWSVAVGEPAPEFWQTQVREALTDGKLRTLDSEVEKRWIRVQLVPIADAGYADLFGTDITKKKAVNTALADSELRYRRLFEAARDGILILDAETGMVVDVNPFLAQLLGYAREALLGKPIWELGCFKDIIANQSNFLELQQKQYIRYDDKPLKTADGRIVEVEFVSNVYLVDNAKVIQCNIRDIAVRKRAVEALRASEQEFRSLAESMPQIVWVTRPDGWNIYINRQWVDYTGLTMEQSYGLGLDHALPSG